VVLKPTAHGLHVIAGVIQNGTIAQAVESDRQTFAYPVCIHDMRHSPPLLAL
jgi:hypothetical protein